MSEKPELTLGRDPLPSHVQALLDLTREAHATPAFRSWLKDYGSPVGASVGVIPTALLFWWIDPLSSAPMLFFAALAVIFLMHGVSEHKARQRLQLVLKVLREQPVAKQQPPSNEPSKTEA